MPYSFPRNAGTGAVLHLLLFHLLSQPSGGLVIRGALRRIARFQADLHGGVVLSPIQVNGLLSTWSTRVLPRVQGGWVNSQEVGQSPECDSRAEGCPDNHVRGVVDVIRHPGQTDHPSAGEGHQLNERAQEEDNGTSRTPPLDVQDCKEGDVGDKGGVARGEGESTIMFSLSCCVAHIVVVVLVAIAFSAGNIWATDCQEVGPQNPSGYLPKLGEEDCDAQTQDKEHHGMNRPAHPGANLRVIATQKPPYPWQGFRVGTLQKILGQCDEEEIEQHS